MHLLVKGADAAERKGVIGVSLIAVVFVVDYFAGLERERVHGAEGLQDHDAVLKAFDDVALLEHRDLVEDEHVVGGARKSIECRESL